MIDTSSRVRIRVEFLKHRFETPQQDNDDVDAKGKVFEVEYDHEKSVH